MQFHTFQGTFLIINGLGGGLTLLTYLYCFVQWEFFVYRAKISGVFKGGLFWVWCLSIITSIVAFIYMTLFIALTTDERLREELMQHYNTIVFSYIVFYLGAATYIPSVVIAIEEERCKSEIVLFSLFLTAVGVVCLTISLFVIDYSSSDGMFIARTCGVIVSWHCVFMDAYLWWSLWDPFPNKAESRGLVMV